MEEIKRELNRMKQILDKVNEIAEVLNDTNGVTNVEWVKNNINELHKVVKEKFNLPVVSHQRELIIEYEKYTMGLDYFKAKPEIEEFLEIRNNLYCL